MDQADSFKPEGEDLWFGNEAYAEQLVKNGNLPPGSFEHQNLGHNAKKEGLGPNTKR
ncbi:hypothetical protein Ami103574_01675 [Aminipila butyrica]|uniref:Uncharacterized protein n=1 Tax=Aminipila butyrica TaxID=433296 RepID=A0A858BRD5_9FIRM|nr:hypothetical protein [Aminipila butyrica]QIB68097.1 hypothetical protein Ami103574_01675 [Aminipila butyrica]